MVMQLFPGVHVVEEPSDVRTIVGVATSVTAFVGRAKRGRVNEPVLIHSYAEYRDVFGGLWEESPTSYAVEQYFLNGGRDAVIVRAFAGNADELVAKTATLVMVNEGGVEQPKTADPVGPDPAPAPSPKPKVRASGAEAGFGFKATSPGAWANTLRVQVKKRLVAEKSVTTENDKRKSLPLYTVTVSLMASDDKDEKSTLEEEVFRNVSFDAAHPGFIKEVLGSSKLVVLDGEDVSSPGADSVSFLVQKKVSADKVPSEADTQLGVEALRKANVFNLLCIPPYQFRVEDTEDRSQPSIATLGKAALLCRERRAVLIVDPPKSWDEPNTVAGRYSKDVPIEDNAVVYYPNVLAADNLSAGRITDFAPCGVMAGVIARTDALRGVWKAPAGIGPEATLRGVSGLTYPVTDPECGVLNQLGINCLRNFAAAGNVAWGARTCRGADELADQWKYLPVRRLAYFIEESLYRGLKWAVFEPNDERLWSQLRLNVGAFMHDLFRQGAFQGTSSRDAYQVKCDAETTTQSDVNKGMVNVLVAFAPLKPAEFVVLRLQQLAGQIQV